VGRYLKVSRSIPTPIAETAPAVAQLVTAIFNTTFCHDDGSRYFSSKHLLRRRAGGAPRYLSAVDMQGVRYSNTPESAVGHARVWEVRGPRSSWYISLACGEGVGDSNKGR
jgi:hypothetical protein